MLIEWLYTLKESIDKHGIRFGLIITLFVIYRKELRNLRLDKRDEAIFHNQRVIMENLGVLDQWRGPVKMSDAEVLNLKKWQQLSWETISRVGYQLKRSVKQVKVSKVWLSGVIAYLFGQLAIKYGFTFNDAMADTAADFIITFVIPVVIAFMNRTKQDKGSSASVPKSRDFGPNSFQ